MVAKKGTKRAAAPQAGPAKQAKVDPMVTAIADAIQRAEDLPDTCKDMLVKMIPGGFGTPEGERHAYQALAVRMAGEVIEKLQGKMREEIDAAQGCVAAANAVQEDSNTKVKEAEHHLAAASSVVADKKHRVAAANTEGSEKEAALLATEKAQLEGDAPLAEAKTEQEDFEACLAADGSFQVLKAGDFNDSPKAHFDKLMLLVRKLKLDDALIQSLSLVCMKPSSQRGPFDGMVMEQLEKSLTDHVAELVVTQEAGVVARRERAEAVDRAKQELDAAKAALEEASKELGAAEASQQEAETAVAGAREAAAAQMPACESAQATLERKQAALKEFEDWNVACFETLRNKAATTAVSVEAGA